MPTPELIAGSGRDTSSAVPSPSAVGEGDGTASLAPQLLSCEVGLSPRFLFPLLPTQSSST